MKFIQLNMLLINFFKNLCKYGRLNIDYDTFEDYLNNILSNTLLHMLKTSNIIDAYLNGLMYPVLYNSVKTFNNIVTILEKNKYKFSDELVKSIFMTLNDLVYESELSEHNKDKMNFIVMRILKRI